MLKKEEIYVSVESKEQAEMFRKVLEAMGEDVSFYNVDWFDEGSQLGPNSNGGFCLSNNYHKSPVESDSDQTVYKKITFGELIDLLQRRPLIISTDGLPIYEGDIYYVPQRGGLIGGNGYSEVIYNYTASSLTIRENDKSDIFNI